MTALDWPEVAEIPGASAGSSPPLPTPSADQPGPAPLLAGEGVEPTGPPRPDGVLVCGARQCRAEVRKAAAEGKARPVLVDADPDPAGTLVWRRDGTGRFVLHEVGRREPIDPGTRRFRLHADTCAGPDAVARRAKRVDAAEVAAAAAVFEAAGIATEIIDAPATPRPRPPATPLAKVINLDSRRKREPAPPRHKCMTPGHEDRPARLFPGGTFCQDCVTSRESRPRP
jgi:hypothetical protein